MQPQFRHMLAAALCGCVLAAVGWAQFQGGSAQPPEFRSDVLTQREIERGRASLSEIRQRGLAVFATPFTANIGYGDGPPKPNDPDYPTLPGRRPTLQNNGKYLRVNGLDAQTCMECHSVLSNLTVPFTFGVGGVGGSNANALFMPTSIDVADTQRNSFAAFSGRFINPPFLFGSGAVELLAKEMTEELQALKQSAKKSRGPVALTSKGVWFGSIQFNSGAFDTSGVVGVDEDLVVRPFGRKGEFATVRAFDVEAMKFHFGMQPVEAVGQSVDDDADGVLDEVSVGDLSALSIFATHLERPRTAGSNATTKQGEEIFWSIGCAGCHVPVLQSESPVLRYTYPEVETDPSKNVYYSSDLRDAPPGFAPNASGGIEVPLFSDLKRHDMGDRLAESFGSPLDRSYITARLWGVADTAPYLHDGRAQTLEEAILLHGGEAQAMCDAFAALPDQDRQALVSFLLTLRTPQAPADDLMNAEE